MRFLTPAMWTTIMYSSRHLYSRSQCLSCVSKSSVYQTNYKVSFMFPGQGAQYIGMAKSVMDCVESKLLFAKASTILEYDLLDKIENGPKADLDSTTVSQPAIFVTTMAILEKLKLQNPSLHGSCTAAMGLSLGEYSALCFAGCFSFEEGVRLTKVRGEAMQQASNKNRTGMVAVVGLDESGVQHLCNVASEKSGQPISIGNFLSKGNYALSGHIDACKVVKDIGKSLGARLIVPLAVSGAFHSAYMNSAVPLLRTELDNVRLQPPRVTVLSNVEGRPYKNIEDIRNCLLRQVVEPVQWSKTISAMVESATLEKCYEIGPGTVCRGTVKSMRKDAVVENIS